MPALRGEEGFLDLCEDFIIKGLFEKGVMLEFRNSKLWTNAWILKE